MLDERHPAGSRIPVIWWRLWGKKESAKPSRSVGSEADKRDVARAIRALLPPGAEDVCGGGVLHLSRASTVHAAGSVWSRVFVQRTRVLQFGDQVPGMPCPCGRQGVRPSVAGQHIDTRIVFLSRWYRNSYKSTKHNCV
jgi:hypothetical protein